MSHFTNILHIQLINAIRKTLKVIKCFEALDRVVVRVTFAL